MLAALARLFTWNFQMEHSRMFPNVSGASGCFGMFLTLPVDTMLMRCVSVVQLPRLRHGHAAKMSVSHDWQTAVLSMKPLGSGCPDSADLDTLACLCASRLRRHITLLG